MKKLALYLLLTGCCAMTANAAEVDFSFNGGDSQPGYYGNNTEQTYDVAIRLDNPLLEGAKVTSLSVAIPSTGVENASVWLSTELKLKKVNGRGINDPDICSLAATIDNNRLSINFESPYTIPAGGLYVGYSFTVTSLDEYNSKPVNVTDGTDLSGFFLHTSRTKTQWGSMTQSTGKVSAMTVGLEGEFLQKSATVGFSDIETFPGEASKGYIFFTNTGAETIETMELMIESAEFASQTVSVLCPGPVTFLHQLDNAATFSLPEINEAGEYPFTYRITKINGAEVSGESGEGKITVYPFKPVARPLIDEYTGLWCGYCPKGYVVLENMKALYGDRFIAAAYHYNDPMAFTGTTPNRADNYPKAFVNRSREIEIEKIPEQWDSLCDFIPDADIDVKAAWTDESRKSINVSSDIRFIKDSRKAGYRVSYVLIADNLSNSGWQQHNSYSGGTAEDYPYMDNEVGRVFLDGRDYVRGLVFNDVALIASDASDQASLLPSEIVAEENYSHAYVFSLNEIAEDLLTQPEHMRVIAVLSRGASNTFVNCNSSCWLNGEPFAPASVESGSTNEPRREIGRYSFDGRSIGRRSKGLQIVRYSDGTVSKIFVK